MSVKRKADNERLEQQRGGSTRSSGSYGATEGERGSIRRRDRSGSGVYLRRMSSTPSTDKPFTRPISSIPSGRSLSSHPSSHASIRTRMASVSRSDYHIDLKPTLKSGLTKNLVFATFIVVFGSSFQFGYNIGVLNQPVHLIKEFYNETYTTRHGEVSSGQMTLLWSLTTALFIPGGMAGAFLGGFLADRLGRKKSILFSHLFALLGSAISTGCVAAKAPEMLMLGRILLGVNSGLGNCLAPMFLSEISPYNLRGALGTVHQLAVTIGILLSSVFGIQQILGTPDRWPFLMLLECIPAITSLVVLPFLPEPPRFLLLVKEERELAEKALQFYREQDDVTTDMEEMDTENQATKPTEPVKSLTVKEFLTDRSLRMPLFIACSLQVIQQFSGINAIFFYSAGIFTNARVSDRQIPYAVIGTNAVNVAMTLISVPLMDLAGRRLLLLIPMVGMCVDLIIITISLNLQATYEWMSYISVGCVILYVIGFAVGLGPIPMMIGAELFRQGPRPLAMAFAGVTNWVFTFIIAIAFESIQEGMGNYTFLLFLILMILFTIFVYFKVPETKNKTFEEIAHEFSPGDELEVEEMLDEVFDDIPEAAEDMDSVEFKPPGQVNFYLRETDDKEKEGIPMNDISPNEEEAMPLTGKSGQTIA